jgi:NAD(P)-dependent dehydrogenase (short-subunit alcohol dehydrogenase family)
MDYGIADRVVVITGAGGGIGSGLVRAFADQGARLALIDRDAVRLGEVGAALPAESLVLPADLTDDASVAGAVARLHARFEVVDVLVNNAGTEFPTPLCDAAPDFMARWDGLVRNNVGSMMRLTRALLPLMRPGGAIINQASIWGLTGYPEFSAYVASKHAVIGLTRSLAWELGAAGIRVNAVCPGWIETAAAVRSLEALAISSGRSVAAVLAETLSGQVTPQFLQPADLAGAFLFLASDGARAVNGQSLVVSHGEVMN